MFTIWRQKINRGVMKSMIEEALIELNTDDEITVRTSAIGIN